MFTMDNGIFSALMDGISKAVSVVGYCENEQTSNVRMGDTCTNRPSSQCMVTITCMSATVEP